MCQASMAEIKRLRAAAPAPKDRSIEVAVPRGGGAAGREDKPKSPRKRHYPVPWLQRPRPSERRPWSPKNAAVRATREHRPTQRPGVQGREVQPMPARRSRSEPRILVAGEPGELPLSRINSGMRVQRDVGVVAAERRIRDALAAAPAP